MDFVENGCADVNRVNALQGTEARPRCLVEAKEFHATKGWMFGEDAHDIGGQAGALRGESFQLLELCQRRGGETVENVPSHAEDLQVGELLGNLF